MRTQQIVVERQVWIKGRHRASRFIWSAASWAGGAVLTGPEAPGAVSNQALAAFLSGEPVEFKHGDTVITVRRVTG